MSPPSSPRRRSLGPVVLSLAHATALSLAAALAMGACGDSAGGDGGEGGGGGAGPGPATGGTVTGGTTTGGTTTGGTVTGGTTTGGSTGSGEPEVCDEPAGAHQGEGTYYTFADGSGNCSFPPTPDDLLVAAMNHADYAASAACGACIRASGPDGEVTVRIVDRCPECPEGDVDFSPEAFSQIAPLEAGRVPITWSYVACDVSGPLRYHFKEGSNPYWTAVQVRNHRHRIARFEWRDPASGAFVEVPRLDYNYFVRDAGMGEGPHAFRVTDVHGGVVEDEGIVGGDGVEVLGGAQLPICGG